MLRGSLLQARHSHGVDNMRMMLLQTWIHVLFWWQYHAAGADFMLTGHFVLYFEVCIAKNLRDVHNNTSQLFTRQQSTGQR